MVSNLNGEEAFIDFLKVCLAGTDNRATIDQVVGHEFLARASECAAKWTELVNA